MDDITPSPIVRRFTAELQSDSDLAIQTKQYQEDLDAENNVRADLRAYCTYYGDDQSNNSLGGLEIARRTLQRKCDEFFASVAKKDELDKTKLSIRKILHRDSTDNKLAQELRASGGFTITAVQEIITQFESQWTKSNGKITTKFRAICRTLDAHKQLFQFFPDQSIYTSCLCGAITMIVQTSVNYSSIAEQLSGYVAELSESISICTKWLDLFGTPAMQSRLSDTYAKFFDFFIKVATWYLKSKPSKVWDSFNRDFSSEYKNAAEMIKKSIQIINEQAQIENAREVKAIRPYMNYQMNHVMNKFDRLEARMLESRRQNFQILRQENEIGGLMTHFFQETFRCLDEIKQIRRLSDNPVPQVEQSQVLQLTENDEMRDISKTMRHISRADAESICSNLKSFIVQAGGSNGLQLALDAGRLIAEPSMVDALGNWAKATDFNHQILWVISPYETGEQTSAELAALGTIWTAIQARARFISHICQRPPYNEVPGFENSEDRAGMFALVYGLISELLQLDLPADMLIDTKVLQIPDRLHQNWLATLDVLRRLLESAPTLEYCIISGLNLLESDASDMCQDFVDLLFTHLKNCSSPLRILFTTSGHSRALFPRVSPDSILETNNTVHQMRGRRLYDRVNIFD